MKKILIIAVVLCLSASAAFGLTIGRGIDGGLSIGGSATSFLTGNVEIPQGTIDYDGSWAVYEDNWNDEYTSLWL